MSIENFFFGKGPLWLQALRITCFIIVAVMTLAHSPTITGQVHSVSYLELGLTAVAVGVLVFTTPWVIGAGSDEV